MSAWGLKRANADSTRVPDGSVFAPPGKRLKAADEASCNVIERLTDPTRLAQRQKQIDFGKNTLAYERYVREVPRAKREKEFPRTPDITEPMSKRRFDGKVKQWRRSLHEWENDHPEDKQPTTQVGAEKPANATGLSGLSGGVTSFDDFLDDQLDFDDADEIDDADYAPLQPSHAAPVAPSPATAPPAAEPAPATSSGSSLRQRLNQYKTGSKTAPSVSIFATFDDDSLI